MKIGSVEFAGTVVAPDAPLPDRLPQVAFSGRSNVGKSSLINTLLQRTRRKIAHVSSTPGKTRGLNFYRVNDRFLLVDLPGYGYAEVPESVRAAWTELIEWYLAEPGRVQGVVHLVDARHAPTPHDRHMVGYLAEMALPTLVVLTKMDKLKRSQREGSVARARESLGLDDQQVLPFSSKTGEGREELLDALDELVSSAEEAG